ncbi:MAG: hypothetical protein KME20_25545 [Kaiparowitsia implicata GSE-PSE-MK54-09C]|jgi:hypothetical protein|nr:hypothetical protein [Kaiparowitsia implicata GSE-PSE-MK54-09C]
MTEPHQWYIYQQPDGHCLILTEDNLSDQEVEPIHPSSSSAEESLQRWGPFESQSEAIARRVGLIRSGKCKPA